MFRSCSVLAGLAVLCNTVAAGTGATPEGVSITPQLQERVQSGLNVSAFEVQSLIIPEAAGEVFRTDMVIDGERRELLLVPHSLRADNFRIVVHDDDGEHVIDAPAPLTYRGYIEGMPQSRISGSLIDGGLEIIIRTDGADSSPWIVHPLRAIEPDAPRDAHVVFRGSDSVADPNWTCAVTGEIRAPTRELFGGIARSSSCLLEAEIAFDADFQYYQQNGSSVSATIADIENVMAGVNTIYERDCGVTFRITEIIVRASSGSNPYTTNNSSALLDQFRNHWQSQQQGVQRDLAHLMTGRNMGGVLGIAFLNGVCNSISYGVSRGRFTTNYSQRVAVVAHEIGHNFSSNHCNGNNPCRIMCSGLGGCSGLGNPPQFGPFAINAITNYASGRPCLDEVCPSLQLQVLNPPSMLSTSGGPTTVQIEMQLGIDTLIGGTAALRYRVNGSGSFSSVPLTQIDDELYEAQIPAQPCGNDVEFFVQAIGANAGLVLDPPAGDADPYDASAFCPITIDDSSLPTELDEGVATTFTVAFDSGSDTILTVTGLQPRLLFRVNGGSFSATNLVSLGGDAWEGTLPAAQCDDTVDYYFQLTGAMSGIILFPAGGSTSPYAATVECATEPNDCVPDLAPPFGVFDIFDVLEFLSLFEQGCP